MPRVSRPPYLTASHGRVDAGVWHFSGDKSPVASLANVVPDWDGNTSVKVDRAVKIDMKGIYSDCRLPREAGLELVVVWHCTGTNLRGCASRNVLPYSLPSASPVRIKATIPGSELAQSVTVSTLITLRERVTSPGSRIAPRLAGSVLWSDEVRLVLEGDNAGFPVQIADFALMGLPAEAAWFLDMPTDDFHAATLGAIRLLVNSRKGRIVSAISGDQLPENQVIREAIRYDTGRTMVEAALCNEDFLEDSSQFPEGSLGCTLRRLLVSLFPDSEVRVVARLRRDFPTEFHARLQAQLGLFED